MSDAQNRAVLREYRIVVAEAVVELRAQEVRNTYAALTLPELAAQHLKALDNTDENRPGRLQRIEKIKTNLKNKLAGIKAIDPSAFRTPDPKRDANT